MSRFAYFSKHALERVNQRTKLNQFTIAEILDFGLAIDVGSEPVFDRKHWLFFSLLDDCCYVATQDSLTGLVVTVLPMNYHENLAWKVSPVQLQQAEKLASKDISHLINPIEKSSASVIILKAHYLCEQDYLKTSTLAKINASDHNGDLLNLLNNDSFAEQVEFYCQAKCIDPSTVSQLSVTLGKKGESLRVDWNFQYEQSDATAS